MRFRLYISVFCNQFCLIAFVRTHTIIWCSCGIKAEIFDLSLATADQPPLLILPRASRPGNWTFDLIYEPGSVINDCLEFYYLKFVFIFPLPRLAFYAISGGKVFFPISYTCN